MRKNWVRARVQLYYAHGRAHHVAVDGIPRPVVFVAQEFGPKSKYEPATFQYVSEEKKN